MIPSPTLAICKSIARWRLKRPIHRTIQTAFDTLEPFDQAVFYGHRIQSLSYRQLAEMHRVTVDEIMQAMMRALAVISSALDEKHPSWWQLLDPNSQ